MLDCYIPSSCNAVEFYIHLFVAASVVLSPFVFELFNTKYVRLNYIFCAVREPSPSVSLGDFVTWWWASGESDGAPERKTAGDSLRAAPARAVAASR